MKVIYSDYCVWEEAIPSQKRSILKEEKLMKTFIIDILLTEVLRENSDTIGNDWRLLTIGSDDDEGYCVLQWYCYGEGYILTERSVEEKWRMTMEILLFYWCDQ